MTRFDRRGVTLLELLVAITLLSLLATGILFAFRIGLNAMTRSNERFVSNRRVLGVERILAQQVAGFIPVKADCRPRPDAPEQRLPFFQGEVQTMRFVSTYSLDEASRGYPRILEFQVIPGETAEGVRLVVNEFIYTGPLSAGATCLGYAPDPATGHSLVMFKPVAIGASSFVLADKLAYCRFAFKEEREAPAPPVWHTRWPHLSIPAAVRVDMAPLRPDPSKLQVPAFTAVFHPDRNTMKAYADWP